MRTRPLFLIVAFGSALLSGCAGPASPLGAINGISPEKLRVKPAELPVLSKNDLEYVIPPSIEFHPKRQVLHDSATLRIRIRDALGITPTYRVRVFHNGYDVSDAFHTQVRTTIFPGAHVMELAVSDVRFLATEENEVEVYYFREARESAATRATFDTPVCRPFARDQIAPTASFGVPSRLLKTVEQSSLAHGYNPVYISSLVAQEPAKLKDERSVEGGLKQLDTVRRFWYAPENFGIVQNSFGDTEIGIAKVLLASYHSGPARVKRALLAHGADWLNEEESLFETKEYVNRIFSRCYHLSAEPGVKKDEIPTKVAAAP